MALGPGLFASSTNGKAPKRFIFIHKGNGLLPNTLAPPTLSEEDKIKEKKKEAFEVSLGEHDLPAWMGALSEHKRGKSWRASGAREGGCWRLLLGSSSSCLCSLSEHKGRKS